ncbi:helix-turn-helix domain-containing protein [Fodinicola feengrottensis]|nr:winged helix-turn-helix domain-containing protein [Fodinicola feengrottensis]
MRPKRQITDPEVLKGLTQPLRRKLYRLLGQLGPATAGALAKHTETDPGLVSYHLRELARHGFITEAPELARDRRERWWRLVPGSTSWDTLDFQGPEGAAIAATAKAQMVADEFERLSKWEQVRHAWTHEWSRASVASDSQFRLTAAELTQLSAELLTVLDRWADVGKHPDGTPLAADDDREAVFLFFHAFPEKP